MALIRRALLSVTDKTGLVEFASGLEALGVELISTGGTARQLREAGLAVRDVAEVTGFPEMLDGRVKTMHPRVLAGILAIRGNHVHEEALALHAIQPIDMVVVNLYDFSGTAQDAGAPREKLLEQIDIGGPSMIRSAAKNYQDVAVLTAPSDYESVLNEMRENQGSLAAETLWQLARKAFSLTASYDLEISNRFEAPGMPSVLRIQVPKRFDLRYGENPHQQAALYSGTEFGVAGAEQLQGKDLSYNNLVDLDAAWQLVSEFASPAAAIVKHTNPCGCAEQETLAGSYQLALACDPVSAFGGVIGFNRTVDAATAQLVTQMFTEAIAAPGYDAEALAIFGTKKNLRLIRVRAKPEAFVVRSLEGGYLAQTADTVELPPRSASVVSRRPPTDDEWRALEFGWKVVKHVKSNAIVYARPGQAIGIGAGQMSRVDSVRIGALRAVLPLENCVVASDAFFPFADGLEEAVRNGARALIEPGGSVKDGEVIAAADRLNAALVFTGIRHFRH